MIMGLNYFMIIVESIIYENMISIGGKVCLSTKSVTAVAHVHN